MLAVRGTVPFGKEHGDRLPDYFLDSTTEHRFRCRIEVHNFLALIDRDNGVHRRIKYAAEDLLAVVRGRDRGFLFGNIDARADEADESRFPFETRDPVIQ